MGSDSIDLELNPVRADMVNHPTEYLWSSYAYNVLGKARELVIGHVLYTRLSKSNRIKG
jgi:putative transposase